MAKFDEHWQAVSNAFYVELADALRARNWAEVEGMTTPEFTDAIREGRWADVAEMGDAGNDVETTHLIRIALGNDFDSDNAVIDAARRGDTAHLDRVGRYRTRQREKILYDVHGRVGMS